MALFDKPDKHWANPHRVKAFQVSWQGFKALWRQEVNFRLHLALSLIVVILGLVFSLDASQWLWIGLAISLVISSEIINTALEALVDLLVGDTWHPVAKYIKDLAALSVVIHSLFALLVGLVIFGPKIFALF
ncbi:TPA: diacylglycerol kinase [Streptococcus suis]